MQDWLGNRLADLDISDSSWVKINQEKDLPLKFYLGCLLANVYKVSFWGVNKSGSNVEKASSFGSKKD